MSAAAMNGPSDGVKPSAGGSSKQQFKSSGAAKAVDGAPRKQTASPKVDGQQKKQSQPQPRAWQGHNPITQRSSSGMTNGTPVGTEKPLPRLPPQAQMNNATINGHAEKHAHDRLLYITANFQGMDTTLTLKNGEQYTGVFSGGNLDTTSKSKYVLKMARRTRLPSDQQVNGNVDMPDEYTGEGEDHVMAFDVQDTADLAVKDVVTASTQPMQNGSIASSFRTDTEISRRESSMPRERELQRWQPDVDPGIDMSLEASVGGNWDQFAANERMYGVQSTYDEDIYTTSIDRSNPRYRQLEAQAARIEREIQGSAPANAHVAEERRRDAEKGDGMDEEEKYSGVRTDPAVALPRRGAGSYVPPSQRPLTNAPTVPGAPFDPAIISLAKPTSTPVEPAPVPEPIPKPEQAKPSTAENASREPSVPPATQPQAEDNLRKTVDAFKQFANIEKLKVRQAQEQKRAGARQEKNVKLNDLKKFAANFKLKSRVPDDLVPILAKDSQKQREIQSKAEEAAKEHERKKTETTPNGTPSISASGSPQVAAPPPPEQRVPSFNQHTRGSSRVSQQLRGPLMPGPAASPRGLNNNQRAPQTNPRFAGLPQIQPLSADINARIPAVPAGPAADRVPLSPSSATSKFNINAIEFRPTAPNFTPAGTTPSPQRNMSNAEPASEPTSASFFGKDKKPTEPTKSMDELAADFNPVKRMLEEYKDKDDKMAADNGGIPPAFRTQPTWPGADGNKSYKDAFPKQMSGTPGSQGVSPMHTTSPSAGAGAMPHAHQLPMHMQNPPQMNTPTQRPYFPQQGSHGPGPQGFDPRMQQFGPYNGSSVQNSPRFNPAQMAFGGQMPQMPPHMVQHMPQMQGQQFGGGPMPGMQQYGVSPSMQPRQMQMQMPGQGIPGMSGPNGPAGMMGMPVNGQFGTMPQGHNMFQRPGPPFGNQGQPMGGQMMVPNPSNGPYMNGPGGMPPQAQGYSPMPHHAQPNLPHHMQGPHPGTPGGYNTSPRPPMMSHSGSHQGFNPQQQMQGFQPGMGGAPGMQQGGMPFAPSPAQPHPMHWQGRQMSSGGSGYPQMTPRQQQAVPHQPSPGMGGGPQGGEEQKVG